MRVLAQHRLRDMSVFLSAVNSPKHLALVPEVQETLDVWSAMTKDLNWVLIGGLALSFYRKPRSTQDVDVLLLNEASVPFDEVQGFKKVRPHTFRENGTHVEVELVTPLLVGLPQTLVKQVFETAHTKDGIKVASLEGMIALKLYGAENAKRKHADMADIIAMLITHGREVNMDAWSLTPSHKALYQECITSAF